MSETSAFEILGPIMIGPSSSHTAGALRIASLARSLVKGRIVHVDFVLYNSFAKTYHGHGTDRALLGGILGFGADDPRIKNSFEEAAREGLSYRFIESDAHEGKHPNTVDIKMHDAEGTLVSVRGESRGGGRISISRINGIEVDLTGEYNTLFVAHRDVPGVLGSISTTIGDNGINIAFMRSYRQSKGGLAYTVFETDEDCSHEVIAAVERCPGVNGAVVVQVPGSTPTPGLTVKNDFKSGAKLLKVCAETGWSIGRAMFEREAQLCGEDAARAGMQRVLEVMRDSVHTPLERPEKSLGGLIGGEAQRVFCSSDTVKDIMGAVRVTASAYAMAVLERSATMGLIVAAPTAGASGVVPGTVLAAAERLGSSDAAIREALYTAAAVGYLISRNATVSGAEGGCQAEVGSASAMAAAALAELMGATPECALHAAAIALSNQLGLVCDPIGGLVEAPCQMRNAAGAANAFTGAALALGGVTSIVPFDEVVDTMLAVGRALPTSLRETAQGGLAVAPSACSRCAGC